MEPRRAEPIEKLDSDVDTPSAVKKKKSIIFSSKNVVEEARRLFDEMEK